MKMIKRLRCRLFGHGPFYQEQLYERDDVIHYFTKLRDKYGRAWGWPTCKKCGWQVFTMDWIGEDDFPSGHLPLEWF